MTCRLALFASADGRVVVGDVRHEALALHNVEELQVVAYGVALFASADSRAVGESFWHEAFALHDPEDAQRVLRLQALLTTLIAAL